MGDGTKFDFDSLRWWRFIDRNTHAHANPDALRHVISNADPVRNAISYPFCDTFAVGNAFCDTNTNTDASSGSYANRCRVPVWKLPSRCVCRS